MRARRRRPYPRRPPSSSVALVVRRSSAVTEHEASRAPRAPRAPLPRILRFPSGARPRPTRRGVDARGRRRDAPWRVDPVSPPSSLVSSGSASPSSSWLSRRCLSHVGCLFRTLARRRRRACAVGVGQVRDLPLRLVADVAHAALAAHLARLEDVDQGAAQPPRRPLRLGLPQAHVRTDGTR